MADYPDWSRLVQLIGSDIKVPIDVQGQYITLDINILSTTADIDVNINAQNVELDIDLTAQHVGLYLVPDWYTKEGDDKNFFAGSGNVASGGNASGNYTVPAGKTLYLCGLAFSIYGVAAADKDKDQIGRATLYNSTDVLNYCQIGGHGGGAITFPKPIAVPTGKQLDYVVYNYSNHNCGLSVSAFGYEI